MSPSMQPSASQTDSAMTCVHRWRIGQPINGVCAARCAHCGSTRDYPSTVSMAPRAGTTVGQRPGRV